MLKFLFDTFKDDEVFDVVDELDEEGLIAFRTLRLNTLFFWFPGFSYFLGFPDFLVLFLKLITQFCIDAAV